MEQVKIAYNNHKPHFDYVGYCEDDFYILSSFQDKITGRNEMATTGGTGLTTLVSNLTYRSDAYNCYVISGFRKLNFITQYLEINEDYWYGFNDEKDFINFPPAKCCFQSNPFFMPGTAYNLNFVLEKEA